MEHISVDSLELRVIRSAKRRTVLLRIASDGVPEILCPRSFPTDELYTIAHKHSEKLYEYLEKHRERSEKRDSFSLEIGSELRFLGKSVRITERVGNLVGYDDKYFYVPPGLSPERLKKAVIQIYKLSARKHIALRVEYYASIMGLNPMSVKINSARSHWASCSAKDTLNFTWYLMMTDPETIDYVVIHELCHMKEFNHSPRFWQLVSQYCPDYAEKKRILKELWSEITQESWED